MYCVHQSMREKKLRVISSVSLFLSYLFHGLAVIVAIKLALFVIIHFAYVILHSIDWLIGIKCDVNWITYEQSWLKLTKNPIESLSFCWDPPVRLIFYHPNVTQLNSNSLYCSTNISSLFPFDLMLTMFSIFNTQLFARSALIHTYTHQHKAFAHTKTQVFALSQLFAWWYLYLYLYRARVCVCLNSPMTLLCMLLLLWAAVP